MSKKILGFKIVLISFLVLFVFSFFLVKFRVLAFSDSKQILLSTLEKLEVVEQSEIYINDSEITDQDLDELLQNLDNKILIFYNDETRYPEGYPKDLRHTLTFYFNSEKYVLDTQYKDSELNEVVKFLEEKISRSYFENGLTKINKTSNNKYDFIPFVSGSSRKVVDSSDDKYGYIDFDYEMLECANVSNKDSHLILINTKSSFVCARMAYDNGDKSYSENYYQYADYTHLSTSQGKDYDESTQSYRQGGEPHLKDWWPVNEPLNLVITSSFDIGFKFGGSYEKGFGPENAITSTGGISGDVSIGYSYSKQYETKLPELVVQKGSTNTKEVQWHYAYIQSNPTFIKDPSLNQTQTCNASQSYLFEIDRKDMYYRDFVFHYELMGEFAERNGWGWKLGTRSGILSDTIEVYAKYIKNGRL